METLLELTPNCGTVYIGCSRGTFTARDSNQNIPYCNIHVISPQSSGNNNSLNIGYRAEKLKMSGDIFQSVSTMEIGSKVNLSYDRYGRVISVTKA